MEPLTHRHLTALKLAVIPVAALVASHVVFSQVFPGQPGYQFPWAYFLTVVTVMLCCWEVNLLIFRWLDSRLPFQRNPTRRLLRQFLLGGSATLLTFALVFPLAQRVYTHQWPAPATILKGITVCVVLASLVNGGYAGMYLLQAFFAERQTNSRSLFGESVSQPAMVNTFPSSLTLVTIDVMSGQLRLPLDQIAYFYSSGGLVLLIKADGQQLTTSYSSFARLMPVLERYSFFQLSRQFIVSSGAVRSVQDDINRKLVVTLVPALHKQQADQKVIVSRYRSLELRKWLQAAVQA